MRRYHCDILDKTDIGIEVYEDYIRGKLGSSPVSKSEWENREEFRRSVRCAMA